jgi:hypothetical protein
MIILRITFEYSDQKNKKKNKKIKNNSFFVFIRQKKENLKIY